METKQGLNARETNRLGKSWLSIFKTSQQSYNSFVNKSDTQTFNNSMCK